MRRHDRGLPAKGAGCPGVVGATKAGGASRLPGVPDFRRRPPTDPPRKIPRVYEQLNASNLTRRPEDGTSRNALPWEWDVPPEAPPVSPSPARPQPFLITYGRGLPQFPQNLPVFCVPQEHVHGPSAGCGLGLPQFPQNRPAFCVPHEQVHVLGAAAPGILAAACCACPPGASGIGSPTGECPPPVGPLRAPMP